MRTHGTLRDEEATGAAWEAGRGAVVGSTKVRSSRVSYNDMTVPELIFTQWGVGAAILAAAGYKISPIYRGLTFQFKVYASPRRYSNEAS